MATSYRSVKPKSARSLTRMAVKMASRNQEIRPVGAWVQPETMHYNDAVSSARNEEGRIHKIQADKEARLKTFQDEVRRRVTELDRAKQQQQLSKAQRAAEVDRKVVSQSAAAAEQSTPLKDWCTVREEANLSIHMPLSSQGGIAGSRLEKTALFEKQSNEVHKLHSLARKNLATRQIISNEYEHDDLPGGVWHTGPTLDHPISRKENAWHQNESELDGGSVEPGSRGRSPEVITIDRHAPRERSREDRIAIKSANTISGTDIERVPYVPNIYPGVQSEEERVRSQQQRALYRRLFMDIEREQVKENIRQRDHRKRMASLKKLKEDERMRVELASQRVTEPVDPLTGQTTEESQSLEITNRELSQQSLDEQKIWKQKNKEIERFLDALKINLKEKIEKQNLDVPQLCSCSPNIWDTNPNTCANNCIFYKNPKGYARALQSLLVSCNVW